MTIPGNCGEIWLPLKKSADKPAAGQTETIAAAAGQTDPADAVRQAQPAGTDCAALEEAFEKGRIAGLQEAILTIMSKNGPVTDQMLRDVTDNVYHDSLINWIKSFW